MPRAIPPISSRPQAEAIAVGLMCKAPRPGHAKTRLGHTIGADLAAALSESFLRDVATIIESLQSTHNLQGYGLYAPIDAAAEISALLPRSFCLVPQQGVDFSSIVHGAIANLLERHRDGAILINSDSPTLPPKILAMALDEIRRHEDCIVLGPAFDGGYYLIGLKYAHWELFRDIPWSTNAVARITRDRARQLNIPTVELPMWYDVDDAADFSRLLKEIAGAPPSFGNLEIGKCERSREFDAAPALATRAMIKKWAQSRELVWNQIVGRSAPREIGGS
jgi:rSAM/selenodomain-associated transferase 1